jgi:hypothetical protein
MRISMAFIAFVCALGAILFAIIWHVTAPVVAAADSFFQTNATAGPTASYEIASQSFRQATTESVWEQAERSRGLFGFRSASWSDRSVENGIGELRGQLNLTSGNAVPVTVRLIRNVGGAWQILSLDFPGGGLAAASPAAIPASALNQQSAPQSFATPGGSAPAAASAGMPYSRSVQPAPAATAGSSISSQIAAPPAPTNSTADSLQPMMVPPAKVAGICAQAFQERERVQVTGAECFQGLGAATGASTSCVIRYGGIEQAVRATTLHFDPVNQHVDVDCALGAIH